MERQVTLADLDDSRYTVGGMFNYAKWSRDNVPKSPATLKVGDRVLFTVETEITKVGKDCDGTVLYEADMIGFGWREDCFTPLPAQHKEA